MALLGNFTFNNLRDLLVEQLEDVYDAENRIIEALPMMRDAATSQQLKGAFQMHTEQSKTHATRLERVFEQLNCQPKRETCAAMKGLVKEGQEMIDAGGDPNVRDAALIAAAQRVEHYEMAAYGTLRALARQLGLTAAVPLLQQTLDEEGQTDQLLTQIAEQSVNPAAGQGNGMQTGTGAYSGASM